MPIETIPGQTDKRTDGPAIIPSLRAYKIKESQRAHKGKPDWRPPADTWGRKVGGKTGGDGRSAACPDLLLVYQMGYTLAHVSIPNPRMFVTILPRCWAHTRTPRVCIEGCNFESDILQCLTRFWEDQPRRYAKSGLREREYIWEGKRV